MNGPPTDVVVKGIEGTKWRYDAEGNELQEVSIGTVAEMRPLHKQLGEDNGLNEMLAIQDGAHDLQLVVEVEEEEVEDGDGHHNNIMRRDDQSVGDASLWSGRWTGRSA